MNDKNIPGRVATVQGRPTLTAEHLRELLSYDPETGEFRWLPRPGGRARLAGKVAGIISERGYVRIEIDGKRYYAHRLAHFYMTGEWPSTSIDHEERNRADNRWSKLRPATRSQQTANQGLNTRNKSGCKGVYWDKERDLWRAIIEVDGREHNLGRYADFEKAVAARKAGEKKFHGDFANHARRAPEARAVV
jgi:hypothetical protein